MGDSVLFRYKKTQENGRAIFLDIYGDAIKNLQEDERKKMLKVKMTPDGRIDDPDCPVRDEYFYNGIKILEAQKNRELLLKYGGRRLKIMDAALDKMVKDGEREKIDLDKFCDGIDKQIGSAKNEYLWQKAEIALTPEPEVGEYWKKKQVGLTESQEYWLEYNEILRKNKELLGSQANHSETEFGRSNPQA